MKKTILLLTFIFLILTSALIAQNVAETIPGGVREGDKIELQYQSVNLNEGWENILFNNGPLVTNPAVGCNGGDASAITSPNTVFGFAANKATFFYVADDFTSNATWTIDSLKFFSYQTVTGGSGVTINGIFVRIWNGAPNAGGTVVWGDTTTNRLAVTRLTNIYRVTATTLTNCDRRIQEVVAAVNVTLPAGTYWVEWGFTGTATSGPWQPPVTIANQPVTGNALQRNGTTWSALLDGTNAQGVPFIVFGTAGAACPVQPPTNPNPANNATNVSITPGNATWTNGAGTTRVKVFFGPAGNLTQVYNGPAISQIAIPGPLQYSTTYQWRVRCENDTCGVDGPTWSFTTMADPLLVVLINEPFPNMNNWTPVGPLGLTNWSVLASSQAGGTSPELRKSWTPSFNGASYLKSIQLNGPVGIPLQGSFRHFFDWYANPSGTFGLAITYDDGGSYTPLFQVVDPTGNVGPELVNFTFSLTQSAFKLAFFYNGYSSIMTIYSLMIY
jgi:hypothetical protein